MSKYAYTSKVYLLSRIFENKTDYYNRRVYM